MFDALTRRFEDVFSRLRGRGRLTKSDIDEASSQIRLALLEADVNLTVVDRFVDRIRNRCDGAEVSASLTPGQQVVKIVNEELQSTLGAEPLALEYSQSPPTVVLLAGLQGSGKTTAAAKLAQWFKSQGRNPLLVGADLQRPAAVEQLRTLASRIEVPVLSAAEADTANDPVATSAAGLEQARQTGRDVLIVDTAGRLAVDAELMTEVAHISDAVAPHYTFLVLDSMTGQDAVQSAAVFHATLEIDAVILTKLDGDARGGAALSVSEVVGRPIAFASVGEALDDFEQFYPDRMATRILGMGDVTTLIEKAEQVYEAEEAAAATQRLLEGTFTLDDFVDQLRQVRKMGSLRGLVSMMPGVPSELRDTDLDDGRIEKVEAIVMSMTPAERAQPEIIDASRRSRIAAGSGTNTTQVSSLLKQFSQMRKMLKGGMGGVGLGGGSKRRSRQQRGSKRGSKGSPGRSAKRKQPPSGRNNTPSRVQSKQPAQIRDQVSAEDLQDALKDLDLQLPGSH